MELVPAVIREELHKGTIDEEHARQFTGIMLFGAFTGQHPYSTIKQLRVEQFKEALELESPIVHVEPAQDKIRMEHYVPLHPQVIDALQPLLDGRMNDERMFAYNSFNQWIKRQKIPLSRISGHFVLRDLRKFAEQYGDIIQ